MKRVKQKENRGRFDNVLTDEVAKQSMLLVTMGCDEACPVVPGLERIDWALPDPKGRSLEHVRAIRDEIRNRVAALVKDRRWTAD